MIVKVIHDFRVLPHYEQDLRSSGKLDSIDR